MEKIQFGNYGARYDIISIQPVAVHVLRIVYSSTIPAESLYQEDITIYSQGDIKETTLTGWNTVYYYDGENRTVYLSDNGSVWTEPEEPEPQEEPEPYEPTVEELQTYKISQMESASANTIKAGVDVGGEHFSLSTETELALIVKQHEIDSGKTEIDFYPDGEPSKYYSAEEMQAIIDTANAFINGHEVYCNELCLWIGTLTDIDEIEAVYYGMEIPEEHRSSVLSDLIFHGRDEMKDEDSDEPDEPDDDDSGDDDSGDEGFGDDGKVGFGGNE